MVRRSSSLHVSLFVALAAIALAFVLLRPVCELWFGHASPGGAGALGTQTVLGTASAHSGGGSVQCCASVSDGNLAASLTAALGGSDRSPGFTPVAPIAFVIGISAVARQLHSLRSPPPIPSSFYLRSARILR